MPIDYAFNSAKRLELGFLNKIYNRLPVCLMSVILETLQMREKNSILQLRLTFCYVCISVCGILKGQRTTASNNLLTHYYFAGNKTTAMLLISLRQTTDFVTDISPWEKILNWKDWPEARVTGSIVGRRSLFLTFLVWSEKGNLPDRVDRSGRNSKLFVPLPEDVWEQASTYPNRVCITIYKYTFYHPVLSRIRRLTRRGIISHTYQVHLERCR